jgi:hypothetical protein
MKLMPARPAPDAVAVASSGQVLFVEPKRKRMRGALV